ncbi:ammonium transporter [Oscillibacter valericigenes]|uniref:ammonium transporter n=1 Tax=Oscillibacter valericigenes TaxID=351091 RepID=UPI001F39C04F|nr:ammonium transporter [Oscillibacter valericigenes]MCF2663961.1 ammonium transporter [Oscillibacter valericigenes]
MYSSVNTIWVLLGAALVFFMQAGFAMCEAGFTRAKNTGNILMKNLMDFCIGTPTYWILGFGLMFGGAGAIIGGFDPFVLGDYADVLPAGVPLFAFLIFQTVFCATAATIVSGSMAERTKFISYCIYSFCISAFIYPISGHWIWGGGWLSQLGFHDFAGSTAVHMVGGVCACIGAAFLGPRIGKYDKDGKPRAIIGHNLSLGALGVFILWFCWFGFNGCSTVAMDSNEAIVSAGLIFVNTNLAAAVASCVTMLYTWLRYKKPDVGMTLNAALAGLVAITAGCDMVSPVGAAIIGLVAGLVLPISVNFFDSVVKIDDPVGAISVHGVCGALGTILTGLLAVDGGAFYGGGLHFFLIQCLGVAATALWAAVMITIVFVILKSTIGLRVSVEEELKGLDITEHGLPSAYGGFAFVYDDTPADLVAEVTGATPVKEAVPVEVAASVVEPSAPVGGVKMTKIDILCKMERFDALKRAMFDIGITGMTATNVMGCGEQRGKTEGYFRGAKVEATMLPSLQVSIVVSKLPVSLVVNTARKVLYTGNIGDGKIFISNVENVIKVRTGEQGYDALQDEAQ